ncbi:PLP-dependent aminotransferase family protein [Actinocatenispora thailandica]|uniref:MocR-like pyridoxine biosynthesis transcription factor PdxR n=1 Tax=Actinocatenispora thailandica TaxID=227318 RepID=UPI0031E0ED01
MEYDEARWLVLARRPGERLADAVQRVVHDAIRAGSLRPGVRLPSSRTLAAHFGVSRGVVTEAYEQLTAQGYLVSRTKAAPVVAATDRSDGAPRRPAERSGTAPVRFDFTATTPDVAHFPAQRWAAYLSMAARSLPAAGYGYGDVRGTEHLRRTLADHLGRTRGVAADPEHILVTHGTAQAVDLLMRVLASAGGRCIAVEDPSLTSQADRIREHGLAVSPTPVDASGLRTDRLDVDAVILTPAHQFPTGVVLSGERRRQLVGWARRTGGLLVEDDYDAEFRYDRQPVRALHGLDPSSVAYLGTTSKTLAPALRLAWMVLPERYLPEARRIRHLMDVCPPAVDQEALALMIEHGHYDRHVRRARKTYQRRRRRLAEAVDERLPGCRIEGIAAGVHALLRLPPGANGAAVAERALDAGVSVAPLSRFALAATSFHGLVLGYGRIPEDRLDDAVAALASAIRP